MTTPSSSLGPSSSSGRKRKFVLYGIIVLLAVMGFGAGGYMYYAANYDLDSPAVDPSVLYSEQTNSTAGATTNDDLAQTEEPGAEKSATEEPGTEEPATNVQRGVVEQGATAGNLLQEWLPPADVQSVLSASQKVHSLSNIRVGQPFEVTQENGGLTKFEYEIDDDKKLVVSKDENDEFSACVLPIEYDVLLDRVEGTIDSSLFESMAALGETPVLAVNLAEIFAWEVNFIRDIQPGDSFKVLVEKRFRDGEFKGYGKLLAAEFVNQGKKFEAFSYKDQFGKTVYYNTKGESVRRAFLKAPLSFSRITSRFTNRRFHPVLQTWKSHPAVDYAAPTGTPVKAIGNGVVVYSGWGTGAGNYITLKHSGGYESMYLHLSGFAKGLKKGKKVSQGEVIGFVGSTGYSTGPHLDFRMKQNGKFLNPEKSLSPRAEPITGKALQAFQARSERLRGYITGTKSLTEYNREKDSL